MTDPKPEPIHISSKVVPILVHLYRVFIFDHFQSTPGIKNSSHRDRIDEE